MPTRPVKQLIRNQTVLTATAEMTVAAAAAAMRESRVGAIMIVEGRRLIGIFTERDALYRVLANGKNPKLTRLGDVMTLNPTTVTAEMPFGHALHLMYERSFRHVPVVEDGAPIGMVSARDALGPEMEAFEAELKEREHIEEILG